MPTMGPAVGISEKERDRQIFRELLGSSGGSSVQDDIFESDDEDEVDDSEFESAAGNSRDCEFKEDQLKDGMGRLLTQLRNMALEKTFLEQDKKQLHAEKMELGRELQRANDGIAELVNQRLRDKELMEKVMENARVSNKVLREKMECVQEQLIEMESRERGLQQSLSQAKETEEFLRGENRKLEAVVLKLTEELKSPSNSGSGAKRLIHETRSAPGGLDKVASVWECSTCTFHNPTANLICDMCSKSRPSSGGIPSFDPKVQVGNMCPPIDQTGARTCKPDDVSQSQCPIYRHPNARK